MDPVSFSASIVTLLAATISIGKVVNDLHLSLYDAPQELQRVCAKTELVRSRLQGVQQLREQLAGPDDENLLSANLGSDLKAALSECWRAVIKIQQMCLSRGGKVDFRNRVRWVLSERGAAEGSLQQLQNAEKSLDFILQLLDVYVTRQWKPLTSLMFSLIVHRRISVLTWRATKDTLDTVKNIAARQDLLANELGWVKESISTKKSMVSKNILHECNPEGLQASKPGLDHPRSSISIKPPTILASYTWMRALRISGIISSYWDENQSTYSLSFQSALPPILGRHTFVAEFTLRHHCMCWSSLLLLRGNLAIKKIVPEDAAIMRACREGQEYAVRKLFKDRKASPDDRTTSGNTPLTVSITFLTISWNLPN